MITEIAAGLTSIVAGAAIFKLLWGLRRRKARPVPRPWFAEVPGPQQRPETRSWPPTGYTHDRPWGPNGFQ